MENTMEERKQRILAFMKDNAYHPMTWSEMAVMLDVPSEDMAAFSQMLQEMENEGLIFRTRKERYGAPERMGLQVGKFQGHERGFGFVTAPEAEDVFIPPDAVMGAMHGDRVVARITHDDWNEKRREGEIIRILEHANRTLVGRYEQSEWFGYVKPDHARISGDVSVPRDQSNNARPGQKVVVEITRWPDGNRNAEGRIIEVLGDAGDNGVDILSIIRTYRLPLEFPDKVLEDARQAPQTVSPEDAAGRLDLRGVRMVTIDGEDARDLDDAVHVEQLGNGMVRLGVHIADVTHYVKEGSPLDREALERGTSVYFPDRVVPMLPRELSNGICSLNAGADRLAFTVLMDIDAQGVVRSHKIAPSVIHIGERMTYTDVYRILEEDDAALKERYADYLTLFSDMKALSLILKERRHNRGSVDFNFEESKIGVDGTGKAVMVKRYPMTIANSIIEEFMLLCNEVVSEHYFKLGTPFVYRVHENPDPEKMEFLRTFLHNFGVNVGGGNDVHPRDLQEALEQVKDKPEARTVGMLMLRSLQKARYSHEHIWHFGLAAEYYSHFTSPIRRYPDLIIHRIMKEQILGQMTPERIAHYQTILPGIAVQCSEREKAAEQAERDADDMKKAEYMQPHVGEEFEGILSNITSFGMFVQLENTIEGLVRLNTMADDYYVYDDRMLSLTGERTRRVFSIGDVVTVQLVKATPETRQIDFVLVEGGRIDENAPMAPQRGRYASEGGRYRDGGYGRPVAGNGRTGESGGGSGKSRRKPVDKAVLGHIGAKDKKKGGKKNAGFAKGLKTLGKKGKKGGKGKRG